MGNWIKQRWSLILFIIPSQCLLWAVLLVSAYAQSPAILNGCFSGGYAHWQFYYSGWAGNAWDTNGVNGCGRVKVYGVLVSSPFLSDGGDVTFSVMSDTGGCCGTVYVRVVNYDTGVASSVASFPSLGGVWQAQSISMSAFSGSHVALMFTSTSGAISNVVASGSHLLEGLSPSEWNGTFTAQVAPSWVIDTGFFAYSAVVGHTAVGSMILPSGVASYHSFFLAPVVSDGSDISFWYKGAGVGGDVKYFAFVNVTHPTFVQIALPYCDDWCEYIFSLAGTQSDVVAVNISAATTGSQPAFFADDFCVGSVCSTSGNGGGFVPPTSTPAPTATSSGGGYPTQIPYPTPVCGQEGTPCPVSGGGSLGLCPSDDPCYFLNPEGTPVHVFIDGGTVFPYGFGTPIPIQGGNSTPVIVSIATPLYTAVAMDSGSVLLGSPSTVNTDFYNVPPLDLRSGSSSARPVNMGARLYPVSVCLPSQITALVQSMDGCYQFQMLEINTFQIAGVDVLIVIATVAGFALLVFGIIRQVQEH